MIWQNPWAFAGLLALAVPVVIHLLSRRTARIRRFPTLRFVIASLPVSTRRTRLSDIPLLVARVGILAVAVAALARPLFVTAERERELGRVLARVIVVDTSASMARRDPAGARAVDGARREAERLAGEATASVVVQTASASRALPGAVAWLATKPGRREIVIVSDFQLGMLDPRDLASVPPEIGLGLARIDLAPVERSFEVPTRVGGAQGAARITPISDATTVEWLVRGPPLDGDSNEPIILSGSGERPRAEAARAAALAIVPARPAPEHPIAIVYRGFERRADLVRDAKPLDSPWQGDVVARLRDDATLAEAAGSADVAVDSAFDASNQAGAFTVVAHSAARLPVVLAARGTVAERDRLLLFFQGEAGSLTSAALIAAVARAASTTPPVAELEPATIPETALAEWRRPAASAALRGVNDEAGESDGRWFWIIALILLGVETWMRRARPTVGASETVSERAA